MKKRNVKRKPANIHTDSDGDPLFGFTLEQLKHVPPVTLPAAVRRERDERLEEEAVRFEDDLVSTLTKYFADPEVIKVIGVQDSGDGNADGKDEELKLFDAEEVLPKKRKRPAVNGSALKSPRCSCPGFGCLDGGDTASNIRSPLCYFNPLFGRMRFFEPARLEAKRTTVAMAPDNSVFVE